LGLLINCLYFQNSFDKTIDQDASYEGTDAISLETHGSISGSDETSDITYRTFFDAAYLPLGAIIESANVTSGDERENPMTFSIPYETEFVAIDSLASDFFDPASIDYVEEPRTDPFAARDYGVDVYWLGMDFPGGEGFPALAYDGALVPPPGFEPYDVLIDYRPADDEFAPPVVSLELFTKAKWDTFVNQPGGSGWRDGTCVQWRELGLPGGRALIYDFSSSLIPGDCSERDRHRADAFLGDTVIAIDTPTRTSSYNSDAGMEFIVRSLETHD
jgi:hypothetical protein